MRKGCGPFMAMLCATGFAVTAVVLLATCAGPPMPAVDGAIVEIRRSSDSLRPGDSGYHDTLQLYWFGSGCHLIQLGDKAVLTDPFVTNKFQLRRLHSDPVRVAEAFERIPVPEVVLVNHSHHDHLLDAHAAMSIGTWGKVHLFGGETCKNILAGWGDIDDRVHAIDEKGGYLPGASFDGVKITAFRSRHSPHFKCGITFANGTVDQPRKSPPSRMLDYQSGESYNFLLEFPRGGSTLNVFYLGTPWHYGDLTGSLPPKGTRIDVAIILAPSADNIRDYPEKHLAHLKPKHIVLSHFNTFAKENPEEQLAIAGIDFVKMEKLSRDVQSVFARTEDSYKGFEKLHIPAITRMGPGGEARNVIRIR